MDSIISIAYEFSFLRLPDRLIVSFPSGDEMKDGETRPAGSTVG